MSERRRLVLLAEGSAWRVLFSIAACNGVPIYSESSLVFQNIVDAAEYARAHEVA